jgi:ATP-dependent helicase/nuclease subunit A
VARLYALPDVRADEGIQLMTIHKSKGLEFDTVILPGLGRQPRGDEASLLECLERPREPEESDLLLAPIKAMGEDRNPIGAFLRRLARRKGEHEDGRLLYVAATRARRRLHLLGQVDVKDTDEGPVLAAPRNGSLLQRLWPVVEGTFQAALARRDARQPERETGADIAPPTGIRRLPLDWPRPAPPPALELSLETRAPEPEEALEFTWAGETARHLGTVVHLFLQHFAGTPPDFGDAATRDRYRDLGRQWLRGLGVPGEHLDPAVEKIQEALRTVLDDARGRWILDPAHREARNEYALSGVQGGRVWHLVLDRTFVDAEGIRWIIDYKTGSHAGGGLEEFLDREQERYRGQLERYAALFSRLDSRPIRLGLYFPLLAAWREWAFVSG